MSHKGELGPYGASSEIELLRHLIHELESEESSGEQIDKEMARTTGRRWTLTRSRRH